MRTNGELRYYGLGLPSRSVLPQIKSEMNCIAKNKCPERQKLNTRRRGEDVTLVESNNMYIFAFFVFDLFYVIWQNMCKEILISNYQPSPGAALSGSDKYKKMTGSG